MKANRKGQQDGSVLFITLIIAALVGLVVAALLLVSQQQNYLTVRARTWASEIPFAEAGIEEGLAHLNSRPTLLATNGWSFSGTNLVKQGTFDEGYFYSTIYTAFPPSIVSIGFGRIPLQTNFTRRTVMVTTRKGPPIAGFVAKGPIVMNGATAYVDSFDSSDPANVNGAYNPANRRDRVVVATLSSANPAINTGNAKVFGYAMTGPGGTAAGTVGDGVWCTTTSGIQPEHFRDDFNMAIPDVELPKELITKFPPPPGFVGATPYAYLLGNGDYRVGDLTLSTWVTMMVTGKARLYVAGEMKINGGSLTISTNGSLEIYLADEGTLGGGGVINGTLVAKNLRILGLPTCREFTYSGTSALIAQIYVPNAEIVYQGTTEFSGSLVGDTLKIIGTPALHYDEALDAPNLFFQVASWEEL